MSVIRRRGSSRSSLAGWAAWPLAARAQQPAKLRTVGFLGPACGFRLGDNGSPHFVRTTCANLVEIEGRTVAIEYRWADGTARPTTLTLRQSSFDLTWDVIFTPGRESAVPAAKRSDFKHSHRVCDWQWTPSLGTWSRFLDARRQRHGLVGRSSR